MRYLLVSLFFIYGCSTTPKELIRKKPIISYETEKKPVEVRDCIQNGWIESWSNITTLNSDEGLMVINTDTLHQSTRAAVLVTEIPKGSKVQYFHSWPSMSLSSFEDPVNRCK